MRLGEENKLSYDVTKMKHKRINLDDSLVSCPEQNDLNREIEEEWDDSSSDSNTSFEEIFSKSIKHIARKQGVNPFSSTNNVNSYNLFEKVYDSNKDLLFCYMKTKNSNKSCKSKFSDNNAKSEDKEPIQEDKETIYDELKLSPFLIKQKQDFANKNLTEAFYSMNIKDNRIETLNLDIEQAHTQNLDLKQNQNLNVKKLRSNMFRTKFMSNTKLSNYKNSAKRRNSFNKKSNSKENLLNRLNKVDYANDYKLNDSYSEDYEDTINTTDTINTINTISKEAELKRNSKRSKFSYLSKLNNKSNSNTDYAENTEYSKLTRTSLENQKHSQEDENILETRISYPEKSNNRSRRTSSIFSIMELSLNKKKSIQVQRGTNVNKK